MTPSSRSPSWTEVPTSPRACPTVDKSAVDLHTPDHAVHALLLPVPQPLPARAVVLTPMTGAPMPDMRAYTARPGSTHPTLDSRPVPAPGPEEVLIRVLGVALNNGDLSPVDRPQIPGFEFAGEVTVVGAEADNELAGQQVMGVTTGAFAEYVVAHHRHIVPTPPGLDAPTA